ncbi:heterokaryon incompatibility protein-domain-containing protein [Lophiotrema nucula]|uniref:Heterokaryon incompatibility protein-domain-containing protein n=1 Tax=Lophiotrema nucula TaxID=690887 RepID=A0A6A5ZE93_9PLEO|nr:heterokaryon incompatibility protein-domain-containing protein [Lophiotrema nucula]
MVNKYRYQRLQPSHIRLLELQDPPDNLRLIRRIFSVALAEAPPYTAISYVWDATHQILPRYVVCEETDLDVGVTKSLDSALRSVIRSKARAPSDTSQGRSNGRGLFVWADAISINQADIEEKNVQVSMMQRIYQRAEDVHIWLGNENENTGQAFGLINVLVKKMQQFQQSNQRPRSMRNMSQELRTQNYGLDSAEEVDRASDALVTLLKRAWFTRIWIVQEVAAAQRAEVFCGGYSVDWDDLVEAVMASLNFDLRVSDTFGRQRLLRIARTRKQYQAMSADDGLGGEMERLQRLLFRHHDSSSTVPHDMIYALRGVSGLPTIYEEHQHWVESLGSSDFELPSMVDWNDMTEQVDYRRSVEEVYLKLASDVLSRCLTLDLLGACTWPRQANALPSWVPDWSTPGTHSPLRQQIDLPSSSSYNFSASAKYTQYEIMFYDEEGEEAETTDFEIIRYLGLSGFAIDVILTISPDPRPFHGPGVDSFLQDMFTLLRSEYWKLGTTRGDRQCMVPSEAQEGDTIGLFEGGKTPLVLRRSIDDIDVTNEKDHQVTIWKLIVSTKYPGVYMRQDFYAYDFAMMSEHWVYIGSASEFGNALLKRTNDHHVSKLDKEAMEKGMTGRQFSTLMSMPFPSSEDADIIEVRVMVKLAESVFTLWLNALRSPSNECVALCPWASSKIQYIGKCSHIPIAKEWVRRPKQSPACSGPKILIPARYGKTR